LHALPLLLWSETDKTTERPKPAVLKFLQRELSTNATACDSIVDSYRKLWSRFN
jgi:hypothetical protein